jgi:GNAT superfamily N-acetyltransferase
MKTAVRWYSDGDGQALALLHAACLPHEKWTAADFRKFIGNPNRNNVIKVLTDDNGCLLGSILYTVGLDSVWLRRVCVHPELRRSGLGRRLVETLIGPKSLVKRALVTARARERSLEAHLFMRKLGFRPGDPAILSNAYWDGESAYVFTYCKTVAVPQRRLVALAVK